MLLIVCPRIVEREDDLNTAQGPLTFKLTLPGAREIMQAVCSAGRLSGLDLAGGNYSVASFCKK